MLVIVFFKRLRLLWFVFLHMSIFYLVRPNSRPAVLVTGFMPSADFLVPEGADRVMLQPSV
jgi:hypothetical protein